MNRRFYIFAIWGVMLAGLILRLVYVLKINYEPLVYDQLEYTKLAIQWIEKGIYAYRSTEPNALVTPGFPALLAVMYKLFGYDPLEPTLMIIRVLQCFIGVIPIGFVYLIGKRLFHPATGLLAAIFAAVYPSFVISPSLILTEVSFLALFTAYLYVQVRTIQDNRLRDHIWAGVLLAATVLIRPNVLPLSIVPYLFLWIRHRKLFLPQIAAAVGAFAVIMMPWWIRNILTFHEFYLVAKGESGNPFLGGTDPYFRGTIDWNNIKQEDEFSEGVRRIKEGFREDPLLWIRWFTIGKFRVFYKTLWVGLYPFEVPAWYWWILNKLHFVLVYVGWVALPVMTLLRSRSAAYLTVSLFIFYAVHALFIPVDRYIYGMMPFLMLGTAQAVVGSTRFIGHRLQRKDPVRV